MHAGFSHCVLKAVPMKRTLQQVVQLLRAYPKIAMIYHNLPLGRVELWAPERVRKESSPGIQGNPAWKGGYIKNCETSERQSE